MQFNRLLTCHKMKRDFDIYTRAAAKIKECAASKPTDDMKKIFQSIAQFDSFNYYRIHGVLIRSRAKQKNNRLIHTTSTAKFGIKIL